MTNKEILDKILNAGFTTCQVFYAAGLKEASLSSFHNRSTELPIGIESLVLNTLKRLEVSGFCDRKTGKQISLKPYEVHFEYVDDAYVVLAYSQLQALDILFEYTDHKFVDLDLRVPVREIPEEEWDFHMIMDPELDYYDDEGNEIEETTDQSYLRNYIESAKFSQIIAVPQE